MVIGALTPPLGVLLFTTARVGGADVGATMRAAIPFTIVLIIVMLIIAYVPAITMVPVQLVRPIGAGFPSLNLPYRTLP